MTKELAGFGAIGHFAGDAIVFDLLAHPVCDQAQLHHFDHVGAVTEVA
jgi:hypothetical protein